MLAVQHDPAFGPAQRVLLEYFRPTGAGQLAVAHEHAEQPARARQGIVGPKLDAAANLGTHHRSLFGRSLEWAKMPDARRMVDRPPGTL